MMNIKQQIRNLARIKTDLEKELSHLEDSPAKIDLEMQIEGISWSINTLDKVSQFLGSYGWLMGIGA